MENKYLFVLAIFLLFLSINVIAAADSNDTVSDNILSQELDDSCDVIEASSDIELAQNDDDLISNDASNESMVFKDIYVGQNTTEDGGNGSLENPFANLTLACDNIHEGDNVTLNIFNGTYLIDSILTFKSDNLIINGLGNVFIKNGKAENMLVYQGLSLSSYSANLTINNVIFDQSGVTIMEGRRFNPVYAVNSNTNNFTVIFNNCSFIGSQQASIAGACEFNVMFINCIFKNYGNGNNFLFSNNLYNGQVAKGTNGVQYYRYVYFENCSFLNMKIKSIAQKIVTNKEVNLDGMWFGENEIPDYLLNIGSYKPDGSTGTPMNISVTKYAKFNITENYLGNNQYEIIGTLCWNGTNDTVGNTFAPMTVTLTSTTGEIVSNATLENGIFKVIYTSNSSENHVIAKLDYANIPLSFTNLDMQVDAPSIYYGDDQNITITLPQTVNATVTVTVNNKIYDVYLNNTNSTTYTIKGIILPEGNYTVDVVLNVSSGENHLYASNSTVLSVSKVSAYTFDALMPSDVKVGDTKVIIIELPDDATGNVLVQMGENNFTKEASQTTEIEVCGFKEGDNIITITYSGNDKYAQQTKVDTITAEKEDISVDNVTVNVDVPKGTTTPSFNIALPSDATGNLTVTINGKNYTKELVNGSATVNIPALNPGKYNAVITYSGDSKYNPITTNTTFSISKPVLTAKNFQMLYTSGAKYTVRVTLDGKAVSGKTVTFTINGKKVTANTDKNGYASVKINLPPKSKPYTLTATYLGVKITNKVTVKSIVVAKNMKVKKSAKKLKIKVTLKKVNKKYLKGKKVTLKFKGKTYKVKTNKKGVATFTIKKNVLKKLKAGKKYSYKVTYGKDVVNKKITVKK